MFLSNTVSISGPLNARFLPCLPTSALNLWRCPLICFHDFWRLILEVTGMVRACLVCPPVSSCVVRWGGLVLSGKCGGRGRQTIRSLGRWPSGPLRPGRALRSPGCGPGCWACGSCVVDLHLQAVAGDGDPGC